MTVKCNIVMYHYVRNVNETDYPNIKGLLIKNFVGQINYLIKNYKIIRLEEYIEFLKGNRSIPENSCVLSFDDGFKDHYVNVFPILKEKKISACFFPQTSQLSNWKVPPVHKVHFLLAKIGVNKFAAEFNQNLKKYFPRLFNEFFVSDKMHKNMWNQLDDPLTCNLKQSVGEIGLKEKIVILDVIFGKYFKDETKFCKELYMNWDEMREMLKEGMSFGGHSINHPSLNKLSEEEQLYEMKESKVVMERNLKTKIELFAYPYSLYNNTTLSILKKIGFTCGLLAEGGINKGIVDPFRIGRTDTIELPFK